MQELLAKRIKEAVKAVGLECENVELEYPVDLSHGDFTTNIALTAEAFSRKKSAEELEGKLGENIKPKEVISGSFSDKFHFWSSPKQLAEEIVKKMGEIEGVSKIEVAGPGFINFHLSREYFSKVIESVNESYGKNDSLKGKKILIEKSAPNLFKPFHVGHLLNTSVGESLSRLNKFSGAEVTDVAYPSDISLGVAKAVWSILKNKKEEDISIHVMGEAYVDGTKSYEESEEAKKEIDEINLELNENKSGKAWSIYEKGREINLEYFNTITKRLGSEFKDMFFESESGKVGKEIVLGNTPGVFEESQGAVIFKGEDYGLHTRVFVTSKGLPVYEAKDIGLLKLKFDKYNPDLSVVITDVEQKQYFEVIKKAASLINEKWGENSLYWQHGRLRFEGGKISSRYGNVPLAEDLIESVKDKVSEKAKEDTPKFAYEQIAIAALKYTFLRSGSGKNIIFDFEKALSFEGDSGPYLQYSYVRARSVLNKSKQKTGFGLIKNIFSKKQKPEQIWDIERIISRFETVVEKSSREYEPHHVTTYLTELASAFNGWYANEKIIGDEYEAYKLLVTKAFANTMKNGLWLLGIEAPEKM